MRPGLGSILRLVGPLVEVGCIVTLFQVRGRGDRVLGLPVETLLYGGIAAGVALVVAGIALSRRSSRPTDRWDQPRTPL